MTERPSAPNPEAAAYRDFWTGVGDSFPDLGGAFSTTIYREDERRLFREHLEPLAGARILKTDLWDEAKNTRILRWAATRGARCAGIDISEPIARAARMGFDAASLHLSGVVADVRAIPYREGSFDAVYSMGTVEHFDDSAVAIREIYRVLKPGGRAIIGVPNRLDPFLRPLLAWVLQRLGLYDYGYERSFTRTGLRELCRGAGFEVHDETGILFMPGWLRMLDLACWVWLRPLARLTRLALEPFAALSRRFPGLRRHGYLIAAVAVRPEVRPTARG